MVVTRNGNTIAEVHESDGSEGAMINGIKYVVAIQTYAASQVVLDLEWYEHTDKN